MQRAVQLRTTIERLGPTFVKVAQAISTRVDMLSSAYMAEIAKLQDRVPPFDSDVARRVLEAELGRKVEDVFSSLSEKTVAAASLGQVEFRTLCEPCAWKCGSVDDVFPRPSFLFLFHLLLSCRAFFSFPHGRLMSSGWLLLHSITCTVVHRLLFGNCNTLWVFAALLPGRKLIQSDFLSTQAHGYAS